MFKAFSLDNKVGNFDHRLFVSWLTVRTQIWAALFQWCHSHQNMFRLLCRPHEPHPVCSQLWRLTAPCRTRGQAQQHYTKSQGQLWRQHMPALHTCSKKGHTHSAWMCFLTGGVPQPAHISDLAARWDWAADVAGSDEWSNGGDWRAAPCSAAAEW